MTAQSFTPRANKISFKSKGINIVGVLYLPAEFDPNRTYEGIVMTPPFPQVKDQVLGNYGPKMAERGYVALGFDYNTKGESGTYQEGFRDDENMTRKWEDLRNAISFLGSLPFVGAINGLGFCGGGNIMSSTIITDLRVKAFASVSAMMASDMMFYGDTDMFKQRIKAANAARQKMFESGEAVSHDYFGYTDPDYLSKNARMAPTQLEGYDYYGTRRGGTETYPNFTNVLLSTVDETAAVNLGEHYADKNAPAVLRHRWIKSGYGNLHQSVFRQGDLRERVPRNRGRKPCGPLRHPREHRPGCRSRGCFLQETSRSNRVTDDRVLAGHRPASPGF